MQSVTTLNFDNIAHSLEWPLSQALDGIFSPLFTSFYNHRESAGLDDTMVGHVGNGRARARRPTSSFGLHAFQHQKKILQDEPKIGCVFSTGVCHSSPFLTNLSFHDCTKMVNNDSWFRAVNPDSPRVVQRSGSLYFGAWPPSLRERPWRRVHLHDRVRSRASMVYAWSKCLPQWEIIQQMGMSGTRLEYLSLASYHNFFCII